MNTPTRKSYSVAKKLEVVEAYELKFNYQLSSTSDYFGIDKSQIHRWVKNKDHLLLLPRSVKKLSTAREIGAYPFLEQKLIEWFRKQRKKKISVKRYRLKFMAKEVC